MKRFFVLPLVAFAFSCSSDQPNVKMDSIKTDSVSIVSVNYDSIVNQKGVQELLLHLPTLSFPLILEVDSFEKRQGISIVPQKNIAWFADFLEFREGAKIKAIGKFTPDQNTDAVLYILSSPNDFQERPDQVELIVSLFNKQSGEVDSRILAIASEVYGHTLMKSPSEGKSFVWEETDEVNLSYDSFLIKDGVFSREDSGSKRFAGDNAGKAEANAAVLEWMK